MKVNKDPFNLISKTINVFNIHDYKMLADLNYGFRNMKINNNISPSCKSNNIVYGDQKTCIDCGYVLDNLYITSHNPRDNNNNNNNNKNIFIKRIGWTRYRALKHPPTSK